MDDLTTSYFRIEKADRQADGTLMVYGKATDDSIDIDQQICDAAWLDRAMPEWFKSGGNIREQHSSIAAGVAKEYEQKADGHYITTLVVDPVSVKKVETGVLKGFSIGIKSPRVVRDTKAANGRIIDGIIVEVSLVDRPANPNAKLMLAKSVNGQSSLIQVEELVTMEINKEESVPMEGESKMIPSQEEMMARYASAKEAFDEVTTMCKEYGYELPTEEKQYGETAEEESEEGSAGSGAAHELEETKEIASEDSVDKPAEEKTKADDVADEKETKKSAVETTEDSSEKEETLLEDKQIEEIVEKAVKSATESVKTEIDVIKSAKEAAEDKVARLEAELAVAKSLAIAGGPKRSVIKVGNQEQNEMLTKAAIFNAKAAATSDSKLAEGYRVLAKEFASKAVIPTTAE
jgi:hypothetical protein